MQILIGKKIEYLRGNYLWWKDNKKKAILGYYGYFKNAYPWQSMHELDPP